MPMAVELHETYRLAVVRCDGLISEKEIHEAIAFSLASAGLSGGQDRVLSIAPTADLRLLDPEALHRIQSHMLRVTHPEGATPAYRSVLIAPSPFHRPIAELYKAIWDSHNFPEVEFSVVTTVAEAETILCLPPGCTVLTGPAARTATDTARRGTTGRTTGRTTRTGRGRRS